MSTSNPNWPKRIAAPARDQTVDDAHAEFNAIKVIYNELVKLKPEARVRVLQYASARIDQEGV